MPDSTRQIQIARDVLYQSLGEEAVLLNLNDDHYYSLDDVGARMWQLLSEHGDPEAVVGQMVGEYDVDAATLRRDLAALIEKLAAAGLVTRSSSKDCV